MKFIFCFLEKMSFVWNDLEKLIEQINFSYKNPKTIRNENSLKYIVDHNLNQSQCIRLGIILEKWLSVFILDQNKILKSIKVDLKKSSKKDFDHLYIDRKNKKIYYAEIKSNLDLDTKKVYGEDKSLSELKTLLQRKFPEYEIVWRLVCLRYTDRIEFPKNLISKYKNIKNFDNIVGMNDYLKMLNIKSINFNDWKRIVNVLCEKYLIK